MAQDDDRSLVTSPLEIRAILRSIAKSRALVRMEVPGRPISTITAILEVDTRNKSLVMDNASDEGINLQLIKAEQVLLEALLEKVQIKFAGNNVAYCMHHGRPALSLSLPDTLRRIQRREFFRVEIPITNPALCTVQLAEQPSVDVTLPVRDISVGGIMLLDNDTLLDNTRGARYLNCQVELPGVGLITVDLRVVHSSDTILGNGKRGRTLGCAFLDIPNTALSFVQRYAGRLERALIARQRGHE